MSKENKSTGPGREPMLHSFSEKPVDEYIITPYEFNSMFGEESNMSSDLLNAIVWAVTSKGKKEITPEIIREAIRTAYRSGVYSGYTRGLTNGIEVASLTLKEDSEEQTTWQTENRLLS